MSTQKIGPDGGGDDLDRNLAHALALTKQAIAAGARSSACRFHRPLLPAHLREGRSFYAETIPSLTDAFSALAWEHGVDVVRLRADGGRRVHNTAVVVDADGHLLPYRKVHIPYDPLFYEKPHFRPGPLPGLRYPLRPDCRSHLLRPMVPGGREGCCLQGAEIVFYPTAIGRIAGEEEPPEGDWRDAWETVQRATR